MSKHFEKINLVEVIYSNLFPSTKKNILYSVAEAKGVILFANYEKQIEMWDIRNCLEEYVKRLMKKDGLVFSDFEGTEKEVIETLIENMTQDDVLEALG